LYKAWKKSLHDGRNCMSSLANKNTFSGKKITSEWLSATVADPGGQFAATAPAPEHCGDPLNGAPLMKMRPFLVPIEVETKAEILSLI